MDRQKKIQYLLISHLLETGHIELNLPDGMVVELGILKEGKTGELEKKDDYSWVIATQKGRTVSIDSYNFGLRYNVESGKILVEEDVVDEDGEPIKIFSAC